jgi:enoyl-CoA hydratase/carnithine racemase
MNAPHTDSLLLTARDGAVLRLSLNRPQARNALSSALMGALAQALDAAAADTGVRVVILAAEGNVYSSGHDLKEMQARRVEGDKGAAAFAALFRQCSVLMQQIVTLPKPVIAEVQGTATAAGCQLVASCDLAVASEVARFATPGVDIGLFCSTPMVALSRAVGRKAAMEMLLTGEAVSALRARELGLVNRVVPEAELHDATRALAAQIAAKSPLSVAIGKEAFYRQAEMDLSRAYNYASEVMTRNMLARDAEEGIDAFLAKRQPQWTGT